jgi:hypothetical protein
MHGIYGGCLMEWEDKVDMYYHTSQQNLTVDNPVKPHVEHVCEVLDILPDSLFVDLTNPTYKRKLKLSEESAYDRLFELESETFCV